jgi:hypothetical protein
LELVAQQRRLEPAGVVDGCLLKFQFPKESDSSSSSEVQQTVRAVVTTAEVSGPPAPPTSKVTVEAVQAMFARAATVYGIAFWWQVVAVVKVATTTRSAALVETAVAAAPMTALAAKADGQSLVMAVDTARVEPVVHRMPVDAVVGAALVATAAA